jgi:ribose 5-phosphate isomerase A
MAWGELTPVFANTAFEGFTTSEREPTDRIAESKSSAARAAALLVDDGMRVGLGTGSTVAYLLPALAARGLSLRCVATSPATEQEALRLGLAVEPFVTIDHLDIAIDGADQVSRDHWLIKGGGGAHVREKIVAAAAERFVVIVSTDKLVARLAPPVPVELLSFGLQATLDALVPCQLRDDAPPSPDGGVIADYLGPIEGPASLAARLEATPGVVGHGLFEPALVTDVIVGDGSAVTHHQLGLPPGPAPASTQFSTDPTP